MTHMTHTTELRREQTMLLPWGEAKVRKQTHMTHMTHTTELRREQAMVCSPD